MTGDRIGIDVGGTNTDAVLLDSDQHPVEATKTHTTDDITTGIVTALDAVLEKGTATPADISNIMVGTTHASNALAERHNLNEVGILRIGGPATESIHPLLDWPPDLAAAIGSNVAVLDGGFEITGEEIAPLDRAAIREQIQEFSHVDAFAVIGVFSPVRDEHERTVATIIRELCGDSIPISLSSEIGLLERENATILNAALTTVAAEAVSAFRTAMEERHIDAEFYFGQNDGTLMSVEYALDYPIFSIASGPANSVRGGAFLSDISEGIIVDVGGTTTDIGVISNGAPRESTAAVETSGVRTNFRMPDITTVAIGGGSHVTINDDMTVTVGPTSVGHNLTSKARSFGGETLTVTDIAAAAGTVSLGPYIPDIEEEVLTAAQDCIQTTIEDAIDRMKTVSGSVPVVIVGGGGMLLSADLEGASRVCKPVHNDVANAIGAAIALVSGKLDRIYDLNTRSREEAITDAIDGATENAVNAGADRKSIDVMAIEEVPLSYLPGNAVRISVTVAGDLDDSGC